jgi:hypothetical protein
MPVGEKGMEFIAADNEMAPKSKFMDVLNQIQTQEQKREFKGNF